MHQRREQVQSSVSECTARCYFVASRSALHGGQRRACSTDNRAAHHASLQCVGFAMLCVSCMSFSPYGSPVCATKSGTTRWSTVNIASQSTRTQVRRRAAQRARSWRPPGLAFPRAWQTHVKDDAVCARRAGTHSHHERPNGTARRERPISCFWRCALARVGSLTVVSILR